MGPEQLRAVAAFARVAQHASFSKAAATLGVSPSALSQTIRALEDRVIGIADQRVRCCPWHCRGG